MYLLAFAGYIFYGILWILRFMQTRNKIVAIPLVLLLVVAGASYYLLGPTGHGEKTVEFRVTSGTSLRSMALSLKKSHVITSTNALILWMKIKGTEKRIQAGLIDLTEHEGAISAARKLLKAQPIEFTVTVPEGLTMEQTSGVFHSALGIDSSEFFALCTNKTFIQSVFPPSESAVSLEGYLFPDTYRFSEKPSCADIIKKMVGHFEQSFASLNASQDVEGLNKQQYVTLASIIEKEAQLASERPRISAVFHNRLNKGMPLGADPTVRYIFKKFSGPLRVSELKSQSPYNTRIYAGLPPGPICSPGLGSLRSAIVPIISKELYFVAKWDGSGGHDFSLTYEEHNKKKDTIQRKNEKRIARGKNAHK